MRARPLIAAACQWFSNVQLIPSSFVIAQGFRLCVHSDNTAWHFSCALYDFRSFFSIIFMASSYVVCYRFIRHLPVKHHLDLTLFRMYYN